MERLADELLGVMLRYLSLCVCVCVCVCVRACARVFAGGT